MYLKLILCNKIQAKQIIELYKTVVTLLAYKIYIYFPIINSNKIITTTGRKKESILVIEQ